MYAEAEVCVCVPVCLERGCWRVGQAFHLWNNLKGVEWTREVADDGYMWSLV